MMKLSFLPLAALGMTWTVTMAAAATPQNLHDELYRPQFHFTAAKGWLNDPNGLVYYKNEYHLFFQHNEGGKTWGHAISRDMLHWNQLEHAIRPDKLGSAFSGSAVIDWNNTAGFQTGEEKAIVCLYTSASWGAGVTYVQSIAYSNDRGRTWKKYDRNPVLKGLTVENRDPKLIWHEPTQQWIMALVLTDNRYALFASPNLKEWRKLSDVPMPGTTDCPDFFELPVDGNPKTAKWVFWGGNNNYMLGAFDGVSFKKETGPLPSHFGKNRYAAHTFSDIPATDGRRIQIAWMEGGKYPGMPFDQQMSFPVTLTLRTFPEGVRLCTKPVKELDSLHGKQRVWSGTLKPGENPLAGVTGELFDVHLDIEPGKAAEIALIVRGTPIRYDVGAKQLSCLGTSAPVDLRNGRLALQVLVDRSSIEIFTADGRVNMAYCFLPPADDKSLSLLVQHGEATMRSLNVWELESIWPR
jgi:sucrose-6-phosphate hydrolase SacC (GH32 family)